MSGSNDGSGSWSSRFMKVAGAAAATAAVAGGLYAILSSSTSASSEMEVPFGSARRESKERDDGGSGSRPCEGATTVSWKAPEIGWVKLNVDGSRDPYKSFSAGCGGVLRDESAKWLCGFAKKLNPTNFTVQQTELEAICTGLDVASKKNVKKLIVESDNGDVVKMVEDGVTPTHDYYDDVELIRTKRDRFDGEVRFSSVSNKANRVADRLANDARKLACDDVCEEYGDPPANCVQLLLEDEIGCMSF